VIQIVQFHFHFDFEIRYEDEPGECDSLITILMSSMLVFISYNNNKIYNDYHCGSNSALKKMNV